MTAADSDALAKHLEGLLEADPTHMFVKVNRSILRNAIEALQAADSQPMRRVSPSDSMTSNQALKEKIEVDMRTAWEAINELKGLDSLAAFNTKTFAEGRLKEAKDLLEIIRKAQKEKTP